ncbi:MAG: DNA-directed RNA polymerase subunit beta' [Candidatus Vogelbacteria bacterium RIFOXYD1_FULL_46_19]|uniref:DNA-directed RNA polymerase subunit beta' n=1 Tax=Candidatus Vogelbacteria bacterium RIFOXYD1_FULL_46_19 TaxID=1802439 RepID=A0A1G2QGN8_9BACT|nr:MAG: DNA-directed RNA polymerase subunit beta' [Candidatus Vogelbacteria bacterium RIFOXYD1_FULL_46_19]
MNNNNNVTQETVRAFNAITLKLASPEKIKDWSYGEVTKPETINYRTGRSERGGLFDERIFGPEKDYECYCGKYKRIRYKGIICEKCGVEITRSIVRRERMGHIELASPVAHIWFFRSIPSRIGTLLNLSVSDLEKVIYFAGYIVTSVNKEEQARVLKQLDSEYKMRFKELKSDEDKDKLKESLQNMKKQVEGLRRWLVLDEMTYHRMSLKFGTVFEAGIGAEAVNQIFTSIDLEAMTKELEAGMEKASSVEKVKLQKRYNLAKSLLRAGVRPEWMFMKNVPVTPPALRPMVALDGGRHATSDVNDLYRRVINRNNRLKKLIDLNAPDVILRNEKRILQEAVDALIDNSIRKAGGEGVMNQAQRRPLKSLADSLRGKQGRFRQNLLGKRVDYSGRSVIVVGPELKISQCGLPKHMALELFRPFVIAKILEQELAFNIRGAGRLIDEGISEVWAILEDVIKGKRVFLNRAPTLHRLGIQAFQPVLIEGNAIQIHPLVCTAFNADFDGDQMAVHVPLSAAAQKEARDIIASNKNLLKPGSGDPIVNMMLDVILGCYWVTKWREVPGADIKLYPSPNAAIMAYDFGEVSLQQPIKLVGGKAEKYQELSGQIFETTVGRILFNNTLPSDFPYINQEIVGGEISKIVDRLMVTYGVDKMPDIFDKIKSFGFKFATQSGVTWGIDDVQIPAAKAGIIAEARAEVAEIEDKFNDGLLSETERLRMTIEIWTRTRTRIEKVIPDTLVKDGSVTDMLTSKARGSISQVTQMVGMKGLIVNPAGNLIDFPIIPSYKEGLSPLEYFITTHGSRKGLADTALNTAKAGYLTRKLVDVAQDVVVTEEDCGDTEGKHITAKHILGFDSGIGNSIKGRYLLSVLKDQSGKEVFPAGHLLSRADVEGVEKLGLTEAHVRSPLTCKTLQGVCQKCYGADPGRGLVVKLGEAVGIVAAQAIGEPGTQLTMRTKHAGGVGSAGGDIVGGLPRVEEIFERRHPKNAALVSEVDGEVLEVKEEQKETIITILLDEGSKKKTAKSGSLEYSVSPNRSVLVKKGEQIKRGQILTDGSVDLVQYQKLAGRLDVEDYIIKEVNAIYQLQGVAISRKHIELIIRQMFSRRKVKDPADTKFRINEIVEYVELVAENDRVKSEKKVEAKGETVILGISEVALTTSSFLSAVSFQHATRVLIETAIKGGEDKLRGLKENVIIGRLIPAGTGLIPGYNEQAEQEFKA